MNLEEEIKNLSDVIGQKLKFVRGRNNEIWLVFEDGKIKKLIFGSIEDGCLGCEEKKEGGKLNENMSV